MVFFIVVQLIINMYFVLKGSIVGVYKVVKQAISLFIHRITREARIKAKIADLLRNRAAEEAARRFAEIKRLMELGHNPDDSSSSNESEKVKEITVADIDPI